MTIHLNYLFYAQTLQAIEMKHTTTTKSQTLKYLLQYSQASPTHDYDIGNLES